MAANPSKKKTPKTRQEILEEAIGDLRGKYGKGAVMRLGDGGFDTLTVIPTGIFPLDVALGVGGYPRGRIIEIYGAEGSGKTTVALHAVAETQKNGGLTAYIDVEHALDPKLAAALGVDTENLYLAQPDSAEQALIILNTLVKSGAVDLIVLDSVAALTPQAELDGNIGESQMGLQARLMSYALRQLATTISNTKCVVIFINQLRALISTGYGAGPSETTTGGRALKFYSTIRMETRRGKKIDKGDVTIGHELFMKIVKNKVAPPFRTAHASLIYGRGIPTGVAIVDMAIDHHVIIKKGSWLAYKGETLGQGKEAVAKLLAKNPTLQAEIKEATMEDVRRQIEAGLDDMAAAAQVEDEEPEDDFAAQLTRLGQMPVDAPLPPSMGGAAIEGNPEDEMLELDEEK